MTGEIAQEQDNQQEYHGMDNSCHRCPPAVIDVGHRTGNGSGGGDTTEERGDDIGSALCDQLHIGVVLLSCRPIGYCCR